MTTVALLVVVGVMSLVLTYWAPVLAMVGCPPHTCDYGLIDAGVLLGMGLPWFVLGAAVATVALLWTRRRLAFWVPIVAAPVAAASWYVGALVAMAGVSS